MYAKNPYFKTNILTNGEKDLLYNDDNYICPVSQLKNMSNSNIIFEGVLSFVYLVLDNRVVEQVVGSGNYGNGGYRDANGQYHKGAMIDDSNVQMGGSADKSLEEAYNATFIRIPFTAKLLNNGTKLNVTSSNDTLAFTADLSDDRIISGGGTPGPGLTTLYKHDIVTLDGLFTQVTVNNILHNVLIPSMKLHVFVGYDVNSSGVKQGNYKLVITPSNDYFFVDADRRNDKLKRSNYSGLINHTCGTPRDKDEFICYGKIGNAFYSRYTGVTTNYSFRWC